MKIEFDPAKSERNAQDRGLPFALVEDFDLDGAWVVLDNREDYGEVRYRAVGPLKGEVVAVVFTMRGDVVRVISPRLANRKERQNYEEETSKRR